MGPFLLTIPITPSVKRNFVFILAGISFVKGNIPGSFPRNILETQATGKRCEGGNGEGAPSPPSSAEQGHPAGLFACGFDRFAFAALGSTINKAFELLPSTWVSKLSQCFGLNLAYALPGDGKILAHLLQGMVSLFSYAEAHAEHLFLPRCQGGEDLACLFR